MIETKKIKYLSSSDQNMLLNNISNSKHRLITLLMLDCGLRVSEVCSLRYGNFDYSSHEIVISSLKKRSESPIFRRIPLTSRVIEALADYSLGKQRDKTDYLFSSSSKRGYISRQNVFKVIKKKSNQTASPHQLRHSFATRIVRETKDIRIAQKLLGHAHSTTTEVYLHIDQEEARTAIKAIDKRSITQRFKAKLFPSKKLFLLTNNNQLTKCHVGRKQELLQLQDLISKKVNTIILGNQGIGKSHLLEYVTGENILRLDDFSGLKKTLGNILLKLHGGQKGKVIDLITKDADIRQIITKENTNRLIDIICKSCNRLEYTIVIDDLSNVTKSGVVALEKLKNHFHIVAAARNIKIAYMSFLTNFQKITLEPISRDETVHLVSQLTTSFRNRIEDYETFKNHVYEQTSGNPLFIYELIERFRKEPEITTTEIREIRHTAALKEFDISIPLVIGISSLMVLRYIGGEFEDDGGAFKLFGGAFMLFALFARNIFNIGKRKYV